MLFWLLLGAVCGVSMGALLVCLLGDSLAVGLLLLWFPLLLVLDPSFSGAEAERSEARALL